jgi:transcriptional regulator GlxA family with amidase domain
MRTGASMAYVTTTNVPMAQIAELVGFGSRATFSRVITHVTGHSPRYWRVLWHPEREELAGSGKSQRGARYFA